MEDFYPELFGKDAFKSEEQYYENTHNYRALMKIYTLKMWPLKNAALKVW